MSLNGTREEKREAVGWDRKDGPPHHPLEL